tara:strand:- start:177 stop:1343 length:1167 start_codon:yes stop_codon:yes gene_type:complete
MILDRIKGMHNELVSWRQKLHTIPELGFDTTKTANFVKEKLEEFGADEIEYGLAENGVVALIHGKNTGRSVGLRADMDALPITEVNDLPHKSKNVGKMHACGHDGHTTMLLGAAKYLCETRDFSGTAVLIFQPAEEGHGGAKVMLDEGLFKKYNVHEVYAIHNMPGIEKGKFAVNEGPMMAAADTFFITITGKGAHGAYPHEGVDPIMIAAQTVQALYSIISREIASHQNVVISVTQINAGTASNIIPETVEIVGTVRTLRDEDAKLVEKRISEIAKNIAKANNGTAETIYEYGYPATINDPTKAIVSVQVAQSIVGKEMVEMNIPVNMASEDFSYMLNERPGAYVFLGQGNTPGLHHPQYDFDDDISPLGASWYASMVEKNLHEQNK